MRNIQVAKRARPFEAVEPLEDAQPRLLHDLVARPQAVEQLRGLALGGETDLVVRARGSAEVSRRVRRYTLPIALATVAPPSATSGSPPPGCVVPPTSHSPRTPRTVFPGRASVPSRPCGAAP